MNKQSDLIEFLRQNQPLPTDAQLTEADATALHEAIKFLSQTTNDACVELFCGAVGGFNGHGVYQLIEDALRNQRRDVVLSEIKQALASPRRAVRFWALSHAAGLGLIELIPDMRAHVSDPDEEVREAAELCLSVLGGSTPE